MAGMSAITREEVAHLSRLARLDLTGDELDHYAEQLDVILSSVARISEVAADDVPPTSHPVPLVNVTRPDIAMPGLDQAAALAGAPQVEDDRFRVPRILDAE
jgi:aspartyl-tRNA(Asn)/glutamyl-tRNA(Gln) amidotransferase subunit C